MLRGYRRSWLRGDLIAGVPCVMPEKPGREAVSGEVVDFHRPAGGDAAGVAQGQQQGASAVPATTTTGAAIVMSARRDRRGTAA